MIYFKVAKTELGRAIVEDLMKVSARELSFKELPFLNEKDTIILYKPKTSWLALALASSAKTLLYLDRPDKFMTKLVKAVGPFPPNAVLPNPKPLKKGSALCLSPLTDDLFNASKTIYLLKRLGVEVFLTSEQPVLSSLMQLNRVEREECGTFLAFYKGLDSEKVFEAFSLAQVGLVVSGPKALKEALGPLAPCIMWVKDWKEALGALEGVRGCEVKGNLLQSLSSFITE